MERDIALPYAADGFLDHRALAQERSLPERVF